MTYSRTFRWSGLLMCIDAALLCHAGARSAHAQQPTFRAGIEVVRLDVLVTRSGRPVTGLAAGDFEVRDEGVPQRVDLAISAGAVDVALVLDTSSSVAGPPLRVLVVAAEALLDDLKPDDRVALLTFSERVVLGPGLTREVAAVRAGLLALEAGGATSMRDAVFAALTLPRSASRRPLIVLFSDGADNTSWLSADAVLESVKRSEVVVYPVASGAAASRTGAFKEHWQFLERLANETGGNLLQAHSAVGLRTAFRDILVYVAYLIVAAWLLPIRPKERRRTTLMGVFVMIWVAGTAPLVVPAVLRDWRPYLGWIWAAGRLLWSLPG